MMKVIISINFILLLTLSADIRLPHIISDSMVLQRGQSVPIWGKAAVNERVRVEFAGQKKETVADQQGHWMIHLNPMSASTENRQMTIAGKNEIVIKDSWGNLLKKGEKVERHHHRDAYYSTVIYFDDISPLQTDIGPIQTHRGKVVTLDGFLHHWVNPVPRERVNLVFNWSSLNGSSKR